MTPKRPKEFRSVRRALLYDLRTLRKALDYAISRWDVPGTVYVPIEDRILLELPRGKSLRPRAAGEYPENQHEAWRQTARELEALARAAAEIARTVRQQAEQLLCESCQRALPASEYAAGYRRCEHCPAPPPATGGQP